VSAAGKERLVFEVKSSDDLLKLDDEYMKLWRTGFDGTLEVQVNPGSYRPVGWALEPGGPGGDATIDVVIRGNGAVIQLPGRIRARSLRLEDVVIAGGRVHGSEIHVSRDFTMLRSAMIEVSIDHHAAVGGYLEIFAEGGRKVRTNVTIEDCWFVGGWRHHERTVMWLVHLLQGCGSDAGSFDRVLVRRSIFLRNLVAASLRVAFARSVEVEDVRVHRPYPIGVDLTCHNCRNVSVRNSTFVVDALDRIATVEATPPVVVKDSRILVKDAKSARVPAALRVKRLQLADLETFKAGDAVMAEAFATIRTEPLLMPGPDLRARVEAAFGPSTPPRRSGEAFLWLARRWLGSR